MNKDISSILSDKTKKSLTFKEKSGINDFIGNIKDNEEDRCE
jgi:hypothetical protein